MAEPGTPRRGVEPDPVRALAVRLAELAREVARLGKAPTVRTMDAAGNVRIRLSPEDAAVIAYDETGVEAARYGLLAHTDAGQYGAEVLTGGAWVHVGASAPYAMAAGAVTVPAIEPGFTTTVSVPFPAGRFTVAPLLTLGTGHGRVTVGAAVVTTSGADVTLCNYTTEISTPAAGAWTATQMTAPTAAG